MPVNFEIFIFSRSILRKIRIKSHSNWIWLLLTGESFYKEDLNILTCGYNLCRKITSVRLPGIHGVYCLIFRPKLMAYFQIMMTKVLGPSLLMNLSNGQNQK